MNPEVEAMLRQEQSVMLQLDPKTRETAWTAEQEVSTPIYMNYCHDYCGAVKEEYVSCMKTEEKKNDSPAKSNKNDNPVEVPCGRETLRAEACGNLVATSIMLACSEESLGPAREKLPDMRAYYDDLERSLPYCAWKHASKKKFPGPIVPNGADESVSKAMDLYVEENGKSIFEDLASILVDGKKTVDERNFWQKWF